MLSGEPLRRRIVAARIIRGLEQAELAELLHADGLGKHDLGRIERGEMVMQAIHRRALAHHLRLPEAWFIEPDFDRVLAGGSQSAERIEDLMRLLAEKRRDDYGLAGRDASRAITQSVVDRLDSDAQDAPTESGTRDAADANAEATRARRARKQ